MDPVPLIYNPASGGGRGQKRYEEVALRLQERGLSFIPMPTGYPGHATHLARELAKGGHERLYVLGGDGTISEVANGILHLRKPPVLGCIPSGTGNDFLRDFDCMDPEEAMDRIERNEVTKVDVGKITFEDKYGHELTRYFTNIFGVGFAADVVELTNKRYKWMGRLSYSAAVVTKLAAYKQNRIRAIVDGEERTIESPLMLVCNSMHTGGAMKMAPEADATDGWFDVVTIENVGRIGLLKLLGQVFDGKHVNHPSVTVTRAKSVTIIPEDATAILADGEVYGQTPAKIEMIAGKLPILQGPR